VLSSTHFSHASILSHAPSPLPPAAASQGAVMGNAVVGLGLLGLCIFYLAFSYGTDNGYKVRPAPPPHPALPPAPTPPPLSPQVISTADPLSPILCANFTWTNFNRVFNRMAGFGFGASTIGMFARVGGGVFTKVRAGGKGEGKGARVLLSSVLWGLTWHSPGLDLAGCRRRL
jgi:Na+/H+-translocating membrane pyrophosphatase